MCFNDFFSFFSNITVDFLLSFISLLKKISIGGARKTTWYNFYYVNYSTTS